MIQKKKKNRLQIYYVLILLVLIRICAIPRKQTARSSEFMENPHQIGIPFHSSLLLHYMNNLVSTYTYTFCLLSRIWSALSQQTTNLG